MTDESPIYLDYAASAPLDARVAAVMRECLEDPALQANPASAHAPGRTAASRIETARAQVAGLIGAPPDAIVFTSGATESVNLAILGAARAARDARSAGCRRRHVVTSRIEHRAGRDSCGQLEREGFEVSWLQPDGEGRIEPGQVADALRPDTALVSLMHANNETGVVTDIDAIAAICSAREVPLHVDAAQSAGKLPVAVAAPGIALLSFCAHKLGGPKGVGALYVRRRPRPALQPLLFGGGHESGLRSGTLATHQLVGFGFACALAQAALATEAPRIRALRERLWEALQSYHRYQRCDFDYRFYGSDGYQSLGFQWPAGSVIRRLGRA
jgi:cysteine desulfurase